MADIEAVRAFWESNPLWAGESAHEVGEAAYFDEHRHVVLADCFGGEFDLRTMPPPRPGGQRASILDLGCGVGFWSAEFAMRGLQGIVAADLTQRALEITRERLRVLDVQAQLRQENAEQLSFADASFDHVNCQGVVHHTPDTDRAVAEIARVLKPGGTACLSVYHRNVLLRLWPALRWAGWLLAKLGARLEGRGRDDIFLQRDVDHIVRLYDGAANPIGKCYSREQFVAMLRPHFEVEQTYLHYFPARALPFRLPRALHRWLDRHLGFMIYANVRKPCAA
ncbi:MAG: class I SAM-dependent methyltransferase [Ideonella sp.]|nr:MAG: class I SAM-dependent methyltransferase [Burkholderiaceae bacterium]MBE7426204.1 class I SAM-dependent methyltransferase [Ideonella sp.]